MTLPTFRNQKLKQQAFIHRSYLNEAKEKLESNERLEFLGDSILSFVVSDELYKNYPSLDEGMLTNMRSLLVNTKSLAKIASSLSFGEYLQLSRGEEELKGRFNQSLLADCFEAFIGALFIDQGIDAVRKFLSETLLPLRFELEKKQSLKDPKSLLQEYVQSKKRHSPVYTVLEETGPAHDKIFAIGVFVNNELVGKGSGKSKQIAEEEAAQNALSHFMQEHP